MADAYLYALIIGCEIAFWVVLLIALCVRYLLKRAELPIARRALEKMVVSRVTDPQLAA